MTYKQLMRKLFSNLWHLCALLGRDKIHALGYHHTEQAEWWEKFIIRCEQRALRHAELVPGKTDSSEPQKTP